MHSRGDGRATFIGRNRYHIGVELSAGEGAPRGDKTDDSEKQLAEKNNSTI